VLDVVTLRTAGIDDRLVAPGTLTPQFEALAELQQQGLIPHLGLSTVSLDQLAEAQRIASVCLQNSFNIANRADEAVLAATAEQHIADVPCFPLSGFSPLRRSGRANHRDPVTPPHLPGSKAESSPPPGRKLSGGFDMGEPAWGAARRIPAEREILGEYRTAR